VNETNKALMMSFQYPCFVFAFEFQFEFLLWWKKCQKQNLNQLNKENVISKKRELLKWKTEKKDAPLWIGGWKKRRNDNFQLCGIYHSLVFIDTTLKSGILIVTAWCITSDQSINQLNPAVMSYLHISPTETKCLMYLSEWVSEWASRGQQLIQLGAMCSYAWVNAG